MHLHRSIRRISLLALCLACWLAAATASADDRSAKQEIRQLISATYDKPGVKVVTDPIAVDGDHAVADWVQGQRGGRALLRQIDGQWKIAACGADDLRQVSTLLDAGIPETSAKKIVAELTEAEKSLPADRLRQFSLFGTKQDPVAHEHQDHHH